MTNRLLYNGILASSYLSVPPPPLPLDSIPMSVAFSFTLLRSTYSGPCIRMTDGLGNSSDIPFAFGKVDSDALQTAIEAGQNLVSIWYDQSGNGLNAIQTDPAKMPTVTFDATPSHYPAMGFPGDVACYLDVAANALINNIFDHATNGGYISMNVRLDDVGAGGFGMVINKGNTYIQLRSQTQMRFATDFSTTDGYWLVNFLTSTWFNMEVIYDCSGTSDLPILNIDTVDGRINNVTPVGTLASDSASPLRIGGSAIGAAGFQGFISDLVVVKGIPA